MNQVKFHEQALKDEAEARNKVREANAAISRNLNQPDTRQAARRAENVEEQALPQQVATQQNQPPSQTIKNKQWSQQPQQNPLGKKQELTKETPQKVQE